MKYWMVFGLVLGSAFLLSSGSAQLSAQVCKDDEGMVADYKKVVTDLVETVKKESFLDFEKAFHQKNVTTKLMLFGNTVNGLISCLQKVASDPTTLKEDADAAKAKIDTYTKLKDKIKQDRDALKAVPTEKEAKALIEKFAYTR
jgi:uncharacterized protein YpuA (DUF1002 family)